MNNLQKEMVDNILNMDQNGLLFLQNLFTQLDIMNTYCKASDSDKMMKKRELAVAAAKLRSLWQSDENVGNIILEMRNEERF